MSVAIDAIVSELSSHSCQADVISFVSVVALFCMVDAFDFFAERVVRIVYFLLRIRVDVALTSFEYISWM